MDLMNFKNIQVKDIINKIGSKNLLLLGGGCILVGLGGLVGLWTQDGSRHENVSQTFISTDKHEYRDSVGVDDEPSEDELRREVVKMILGRIEDTPDLIDEDWLKKAHSSIKSKNE